MGNPVNHQSNHSRSSRHRYRKFVKDYKHGRLDSEDESAKQNDGPTKANGEAASSGLWRGKRREYARAYLRWLRPHRLAVGALFVLALIAAGLEMIEPLFMRHIIDRILLNTGLDTATRLSHLHVTG